MSYDIHLYKDRPRDIRIAKICLAYGANWKSSSEPEENVVPPLEEALLVMKGDIYEIPQTQQEPATTLCSTLNGEEVYIEELRVEQRVGTETRHLWERTFITVRLHAVGSEKVAILRLLHYQGPMGEG